MKRKTKENIVLLHRHGNAAPNRKASYIKFGSYKTKSLAQKNARAYGLESAKYAKESEVKKTKHKSLYYISSKRRPIKRRKNIWEL